MSDIDYLINMFKILSDETRLRIIMLLACEEFCVCQLSGILKVSQPNISKHLSKLRDLGFVLDERKDKFVYYKLESTNKMLVDIVKDISDEINHYRIFVVDREGIVNKDIYLKQCKCNATKQAQSKGD